MIMIAISFSLAFGLIVGFLLGRATKKEPVRPFGSSPQKDETKDDGTEKES